jgi:hypothetical protein
MKRVLLFSLAVLVVAGAAMAQPVPGNLGVYADPTASSCDIMDVSGPVIAYIVHTNASGARLSQFALEQDASVDMQLFGESASIGIAIGSVETGISVSYGICVTSFPLEVVELTYFGSGNTTSCGTLKIIADPGIPSGEIEIIDCNFGVHTTGVSDGAALVNATGDCGCDIANEETSWSRIKALYK